MGHCLLSGDRHVGVDYHGAGYDEVDDAIWEIEL